MKVGMIMTEQSVSSPRLASASLEDPKETVRPANLPAGNQSYPSGHVMKDADPQRLNEIHAKMRRIIGHNELSPRQWKTLRTLIIEATGPMPLTLNDLFGDLFSSKE
jgi:hypothetical protein